MGKSDTKRFFVRVGVEMNDRTKHSRYKRYNNNKEKHDIVVQIHNFFHRIRCRGLEIHLSRARGVE